MCAVGVEGVARGSKCAVGVKGAVRRGWEWRCQGKSYSLTK